MADCIPDLEDMEIWLPSDIFPDEVYSRQSSSKCIPEFPSELAYMEDLAQQLGAYAMLEQKPLSHFKPPPASTLNYLELRPASRFSTVSPPLRARFGLRGAYPASPGNSVSSFGNGGFRDGSRPGYQYNLVKSVQPQVDKFSRVRATVLQRASQVRNRPLPLRVDGSETAGTGVFFPRHFEVKNTCSIKSGEQKQPLRNVVVGKQQGMAYQHPSEVGLPQDWTY